MALSIHRVAVLSFLFNWPTNGGGNVHSVELTRFLRRGGYDAKLFYPAFDPWAIGRVKEKPQCPVEKLEFGEDEWWAEQVRDRFAVGIEEFDADAVIVMDAWNYKPWLAEAAGERPFYLRFQALEGLCPLNNLRLLPQAGGMAACPADQLRCRQACLRCIRENARFSGALHEAEREFSRVEPPEYEEKLRWSLKAAEAVLVLNREAAELVRPFASRVEIVPWGMDEARFPRPTKRELGQHSNVVKLFMAGSPAEPTKGFDVLHTACAMLWKERQDFMLIATGEPKGQHDPFTHFVGWQSQEKLPDWYRDADICVVPTIAPDGLSRTSVEAMACGRPVVGSRIGGLPDTIEDGRNGFLFRPGDAYDLVEKLRILIDDADLRMEMGKAGRARFEREFRWETVIDRHYRKLFHSQKTVVDALTE